MSFDARVIRVLVASPSDLPDERKTVIDTVYEWNVQHAEAEATVLLPVAWETHATPRANVRPQQAINEQLVDCSDILIGMFWIKLGTSTGAADSGTVEEIERFVAEGKPAQLYFSNRPIDPNTIDARQNRKLKKFRDSIRKTALTGSFNSLDSLRETVSRNLLSEVRSLRIKKSRDAADLASAANAPAPVDPSTTAYDSDDAPNPNWERADFERAAFSAIRKHDESRIKTIGEAYQKTDHHSEDDNSITWLGYIEWTRLHFGQGGQLGRLQKLADGHPQSAKTRSYLASAQARYGQHDLAAANYLLAMAASKSERAAEFAAMAIEQFKKINDQAGIDATLASLRKLVAADRSLEHVLTDAVRKLAQADKLPQFEIALMERYVELAPDDHETRFNLAYKQSEVGAEAIALHHYQRIPLGDRHAATWNNIGYARDQLGLPVTSVSAYRQSANMGNTLAMSNLANKLIKAGFLDLAREQCNEALKIPNPHQNVGHLVATLASVEEAERTRKDEILKDASDRIAHLRKLGRAATAATPQTFPEGWKGPQCVFTLSRCGDRITLKGTYETEAGGLLAALMSPNAPSGALSLPTSKHTVTFTGQIRGLAVVGSVKREREGASLLDSAGENVVAMIFSDACDEITIIEDLTSDQQTIQVLTRI